MCIYGPCASLVYLNLWSICIFGTLVKLTPSLCKMGGKLNQVVAQPEASWCQVVPNGEPSWSQVGRFWDHIGAKLAQVGPSLACWGHVGAMLGQVGTKLGQLVPTWGQLTSSWDQNVAKMEPSWAKLGPIWAYVGTFEPQVGHHSARLPNMSPKIIKDGPKHPNLALKTWILEGFGASRWHQKSIKSYVNTKVRNILVYFRLPKNLKMEPTWVQKSVQN